MIKKLLRSILHCALIVSTTLATSAQESITIALYDVESIYDTSQSLYTQSPQTSKNSDQQWNEERYRTKIRNTAQVIDSLNVPIIAIIGVESEAIVRDIVIASAQEYCYAYRPLNYFDKLDCALLYYGDYLTIESVESSNYSLTISGMIDALPIEILITRRGGKVRNFKSKTADGLRIAMGDLSHRDLKRLEMDDPLQTLAQQGVGNSFGQMGWQMKSRVGVSADRSTKCVVTSEVYHTKWLVANEFGQPLSTYLYGQYVGGYSSYLPIITDITFK